MSRALLLLLFLLPACGSKAADAPAAARKRVIHEMQLNEEGTSRIVFESEEAQGSIEIAADVKIGYESLVHPPGSEAPSRQVITLDGEWLSFWDGELKIGKKSYGKLAGPVRIRISRDGVTVNGEKRGEL
jgi:hypothetical protein